MSPASSSSKRFWMGLSPTLLHLATCIICRIVSFFATFSQESVAFLQHFQDFSCILQHFATSIRQNGRCNKVGTGSIFLYLQSRLNALTTRHSSRATPQFAPLIDNPRRDQCRSALFKAKGGANELQSQWKTGRRLPFEGKLAYDDSAPEAHTVNQGDDIKDGWVKWVGRGFFWEVVNSNAEVVAWEGSGKGSTFRPAFANLRFLDSKLLADP